MPAFIALAIVPLGFSTSLRQTVAFVGVVLGVGLCVTLFLVSFAALT
jgi:hypothetical protein